MGITDCWPRGPEIFRVKIIFRTWFSSRGIKLKSLASKKKNMDISILSFEKKKYWTIVDQGSWQGVADTAERSREEAGRSYWQVHWKAKRLPSAIPDSWSCVFSKLYLKWGVTQENFLIRIHRIQAFMTEIKERLLGGPALMSKDMQLHFHLKHLRFYKSRITQTQKGQKG